MLTIQDVLLSDEIITEAFVCKLDACKGACCVQGELGAPLEKAEVEWLQANYAKIAPYLSDDGKQAIAQQGVATHIEELDWHGTPLLWDEGPCAYVVYDESGMALCGIENAWKAGAIDFQKPISCHLYPIRIEKNEQVGFEALNYHEWDICSPACAFGQQQKVPLYRFLKDALIRKYGENFYEELDALAQFMRGKEG
jgi:hypothetical protein